MTVIDTVFRNNSAGLYGGVTDVRGDTQTWHNVSTFANHAVNGGMRDDVVGVEGWCGHSVWAAPLVLSPWFLL